MRRRNGFIVCVVVVTTLLVAVSAGYAAVYNEAPSLRARVEAGELPPVEERLPERPLVVGPGVLVSENDLDYEVGTYGGGIFRSVAADPQLDWNIRDAVMENFLMSPAFHLTPIQGNIAETFEISDDNRVFTLTLRKGLKWSDGVPVTTEDVRFAYEDVMLNEELTPIIPATYRSGGRPDGKPMALEILDEYTFRITFDEPYGRFVRHLGVGQLWGGYTDLLKPSHYLKKYHIKYTPLEELQPELAANGMGPDEWHRLFLAKDILWSEVTQAIAAGFPILGPWVRVESPDNLIVMERNPYYYKVDPEGNQLPYVDRYESVIVNDPETIPLTVISGDVNLNRELIAHDKVSLLLENQERGGYRVDLNLVYHNAPIALFFNYNNPEETWRQVVLNKDFRRAVNMAINREEIIDILFLGLGTTSSWFPGEYDPDEANRILDTIGLDARDAEGFRLGPDGKTFEIFIEYYEGAAYWERIVELISNHLEAVGLRTPTRKIASELWIQRRDANQLYASVDWLDDVNWPYLVYDYMPTERIKWGQQWHLWLQTEGAQGVEPPDWILELYDIDAELTAVRPGTERAVAAEARFAEWMMEYIPMFPVARDVVSPVIVPPNLGNLAQSGQEAASWFGAEQFFFKQ